MRSRMTPLLSELHAHSTWSDGDFTLTKLVDLYGRNGFDARPRHYLLTLLTRPFSTGSNL
jgi:hypothetical protein